MKAHTGWHPDQLACNEILSAWGIDPYEVLNREVGTSGYFTRQRDAFGHTVHTEDGGIALTAQEWPKGFPAEKFLEHHHRWWQASVSGQ